MFYLISALAILVAYVGLTLLYVLNDANNLEDYTYGETVQRYQNYRLDGWYDILVCLHMALYYSMWPLKRFSNVAQSQHEYPFVITIAGFKVTGICTEISIQRHNTLTGKPLKIIHKLYQFELVAITEKATKKVLTVSEVKGYTYQQVECYSDFREYLYSCWNTNIKNLELDNKLTSAAILEGYREDAYS